MRIRFHVDPLHLGFAVSPLAKYIPQDMTTVSSLQRCLEPVTALETALEKVREPIHATQTYLDFAEQIAAKRTQRELKYADVPPPADATHVGRWEPEEDGSHARWFIGTERGTAVRVSAWGYKRADGTIRERGVHVCVDDHGGIAVLDAAGLRALAADALAIAAELDRHTS